MSWLTARVSAPSSKMPRRSSVVDSARQFADDIISVPSNQVILSGEDPTATRSLAPGAGWRTLQRLANTQQSFSGRFSAEHRQLPAAHRAIKVDLPVR